METKPVFLLSDSQLLFLKNEKDEHYLKLMIGGLLNEDAKCAYIGASNEDDPAFFSLFVEAMRIAGFSDCKMITSSFDDEERGYLEDADLILLAGGDTKLGLQVFRENGIEELLRKKYQEGTILIGVSAGAIQLGWEAFENIAGDRHDATEGLKFIPFIVLVHLNKKELEKVESLLHGSKTIKRAYEIPAGGGLIFHADYTVEAIRKPINEFILKDEVMSHTLIFPDGK